MIPKLNITRLNLSAPARRDSARTAIFYYGSPDAWHDTSASVLATTIACKNNAEVPDGVLGALDTHEFVYARLMGLGDARGCASAVPSAL